MRASIVGSAAAAVVIAATFASASCSSNPVNVPVRTFERAQKVDVVCMQVRGTPDVNGFTLPVSPTPLPQAACAPVPPNTDGSQLPNHLYALVTQTARGELAVVDLTSGNVVDEDRKTPGINFIPVGSQPTDVAVAPDGRMVFVSAAEPNKPAIYGLASTRILGDSLGLPLASTPLPLTLPALPACLLPQQPMAIAIVPRAARVGGEAPDGGAGSDGGTGAPSSAYELAVVLAGTGKTTAKVAMIDPLSLARGAGIESSPGPTIAPGSLLPCVVTSSIELSAQASAVATAPAATWDDGVKYLDGGVDLRDAEPSLGAACAIAPVDGGGGGGGDGGDGGDAGASDAGPADSGAGDGGARPARNDAARPSATVFDADRLVLYVADGALPVIHAIDVSVPGASRELPPLLVTSASDPARQVVVGGLSISPTTRDFKRFLYAIDAKEGSLVVFDVTDVPTSPRLPMQRPHPELNPFQPTDRILFSAPVAAVSFVKHDWALSTTATTTLVATKTGLLCNPNPNADPNADPNNPATTDEDLGANYRANATGQPVALGPYRLRGVFAFATLSNGIMVTIDVDDWDAPCRRPDPMGPGSQPLVLGTQTSDIAPPEPASAAGDRDPYHAPLAYSPTPANQASPVTLEAYFPVSTPHHARSNYMLRADPQAGINIPNLVGLPQLVSNNAVKPTTGDDGKLNPILLPTYSTLADPTYVQNPSEPDPTKRQSGFPDSAAVHPHKIGFSLPVAGSTPGNTTPGVRFAFEDPQVHINQDWTVTYEGTIPGVDGIPARIDPIARAGQEDADYTALTLSAPNALFCRRGVEDQRVGAQRVAARNAELDRLGLPRPSAQVPGATSTLGAESWTADYVQLADDILASDNPYWSEQGDSCWDPTLNSPQARHDACQNTYGSLSDPVPSLFRDFPILEAYEDHFVVGRYGYQDPSNPATVNRIIVGRDNSNIAALKLMRCCFHHQVKFKVRTGGQWVAVGSATGLLHHVHAADVTEAANASQVGACITSCDPRDALLNARAPEVPRPLPNVTPSSAPDRNSPVAMRNPMFAFVVWGGAAPPKPSSTVPAPGYTTTQRDYQWKFSTRGQFAPLTVNIGGNTTQVAPQSMLFIESLGQLAVVDGASQGLVLIDLNTVAFAHSPFF